MIPTGTIGFISRPHNAVSTGIEWFSRWSELPGFKPVEHCFMITGPDEVTEEHLETGCVKAPLQPYLNATQVSLYLRTPKGLTEDIGLRLKTQIQSHLGAKYATGTIAADALSGTILGHWMNDLLKNAPEHWLTRAAARPDQYVCSGLVAVAMNALPEYAGCGVLANGYYAVEPEDLFCDGTLFEPGYTEWNGSYPVLQ